MFGSYYRRTAAVSRGYGRLPPPPDTTRTFQSEPCRLSRKSPAISSASSRVSKLSPAPCGLRTTAPVSVSRRTTTTMNQSSMPATYHVQPIASAPSVANFQAIGSQVAVKPAAPRRDGGPATSAASVVLPAPAGTDRPYSAAGGLFEAEPCHRRWSRSRSVLPPAALPASTAVRKARSHFSSRSGSPSPWVTVSASH